MIRVSDVVEARRNCQPLIGWGAILTKAIGLASRKWPMLRQSYMPLPWPHLYEHPNSVANIVVEREWEGSAAVFFDRIYNPEEHSLRNIDRQLYVLKRVKIENLGSYRFLIRITRYPFVLRRLLWNIALKGSGRMRTSYFGTFSINSVGGRNGYPTQSMTLHSMSWFYGWVRPDGSMPLHFFFDHRVVDGASVARMVGEIEKTLNRDIVAELRALS